VKIGFLGGSFDPVHFGHLLAAQDARERHGLDRVVLVPAYHVPLKPADEPRAGAADRLAMLRAAVAGDPRLEVSDFELTRGGVSYTIDSARHFRGLYPGAELYWIIGGDQLARLPLWKDIAGLGKLIAFIVMERPGFSLAAAALLPGVRLHRYEGHVFAVSSTELRDRAARGLPLDYFVPPAVAALIGKKKLYAPLKNEKTAKEKL
jgi:nicotinate-nucleotide adenylyltransferase